MTGIEASTSQNLLKNEIKLITGKNSAGRKMILTGIAVIIIVILISAAVHISTDITDQDKTSSSVNEVSNSADGSEGVPPADIEYEAPEAF